MFATSYIKSFTNSFIHLYLAFYIVFIGLKTLYLSITFVLIYMLEARCTHTGDTCCTHNIVLYCLPYFVIIILNTYSILFHDLFINFYYPLIYYFMCTP